MKNKVEMTVLVSIVTLIAGFSSYGFSQRSEDGVGKTFKIDGKPDTRYKLETSMDAAYAFVDLVKSGDLTKLYKIMGGKKHVLNEDGTPVDLKDERFIFFLNRKRAEYANVKNIRIYDIKYSQDGNRSYVYFYININGREKQFVVTYKDGNTWYVPWSNLNILFSNNHP